MPDTAWNDMLVYLRLLGATEYENATDVLTKAIERDGHGAVAEALVDCCRSLMERIVYEAGIVDVRTAVHIVAARIANISANTRFDTIDRLRTLLVFLGSEGLPCQARTAVAGWRPEERLRILVSCTIGLAGAVARDAGGSVADIVDDVARPRPPRPATGTFGLAWRTVGSVRDTAYIAFVAEEPASLRSILARVALLRDSHNEADEVDLSDYRGLGERVGDVAETR